VKHHPACPDAFHVHNEAAFATVTMPSIVHAPTGHWVCLTSSPVVADRIAELLDRHGLADIPNDPSAITAPWPAPDPTTRQETP
jgi:hypothetical protein